MPFDDEDPVPASLTPASEDAPFDAEDGDQAQDFRLFASLLSGPGKRSQASSKAIRRGEKDFESHGTRAQESVLESSRSAMHDVLSYTRQHQPRNVLRGWYFPDRWAEVAFENESTIDAVADKPSGHRTIKGRGSGQGLFERERIVALESDGSPMLTSMGRVVTSAEKRSPGWLKTWLLPEEALFLVERGTLDLWWPIRGIEEIFPADEDPDEDPSASQEKPEKFEDYDLGIPLTLQAAYAIFIGQDGERGKISLEKYQVYANLRRTGYRVLRTIPSPPQSSLSQTPQSLSQWLFSLLWNTNSSNTVQHGRSGYGPLVRPGLYRSYTPIFEQLALVQRHRPARLTPEAPQPQDPFKIHFHVWKSTSSFTKTKPPPPDFQMAVIDARGSNVPTLEQLDTLLLSTPWDPPHNDTGKQGPGFIYKRLKHGWRNSILAIVDRGLISYMRFGEMAFGEELLYENTNSRPKAKRGGRAGSGRGRGRGRGK
ncbi:putative tRNA splicing endonuclease subunit [Rosellinia necatrix]|uniref:Putative tRNA splicing endonuclease subunit n=1 Tax=Rosellinia necatrix TaxID=77044 RepID=A0A1W2TTI2_ROSNE|nr:putative tRNA splicing endonuclease subunit [Rosellinia necatrix]